LISLCVSASLAAPFHWIFIIARPDRGQGARRFVVAAIRAARPPSPRDDLKSEGVKKASFGQGGRSRRQALGSMATMSEHPRAFTLIELLIVVAILAVLVAVVMPSVIVAQTRAKIGRARADMRTLAGGLEAYRMDNFVFPPPTGNGIPSRLWRLTTPITYLASGRLQDPFYTQRLGAFIDHEIEYWGCNDQRTSLSSSSDGTLIESYLGGGQDWVSWFILRSSGPDNDVNAGGASYTTWLSPSLLIDYCYDPTNGTTSFGELWRVGGDVAVIFRPAASLAMRCQ
jgi:prepilin-type N-terminal cleavage/methylation domain-containing protein